ncbi:hypothetical protein WT01_15845 [Burkholderia cepacia]|uniref:winged helix-turn-helix domain-containing protein n=1 Tax=Burkholderia cepacia TaxID=292 RepID=UPI0007547ACD|nr:winged helix-turn-helix domain-containing protein [Burkholderia cepacia]KVL59299.1 hypothetical protein WT01_15845 [Burkholderia cepacia]
MPSIEQILQLIVDHPGITAGELADQIGISTSDVNFRLIKYIEAGKVKKEPKPLESGGTVNRYFPMQSLIKEADGVKQIVTLPRGGPRVPRVAPADGDGPDPSFTFGFFSNGTLSITKGTKEVKLAPAETQRLLAFLDSINIEKITGA